MLIIGTGYMANHYAIALDQLGIHGAIWGRDNQKSENIAKQYKKIISVESLEEAVNNYNKIVIALTPDVTGEYIKKISKCTTKKKFLLAEKPICKSFDDLQHVTCQIKDVTEVYVCLNRRFYKYMDYLKEEIKKNDLDYIRLECSGGDLSYEYLLENTIHAIDLAMINLCDWDICNDSDVEVERHPSMTCLRIKSKKSQNRPLIDLNFSRGDKEISNIKYVLSQTNHSEIIRISPLERFGILEDIVLEEATDSNGKAIGRFAKEQMVNSQKEGLDQSCKPGILKMLEEFNCIDSMEKSQIKLASIKEFLKLSNLLNYAFNSQLS